MINTIFKLLTASGKDKQLFNKACFFLNLFIVFSLIISFFPYKPLENLSLHYLSNMSLFIFFYQNQDLILNLESIFLLFEGFVITILFISYVLDLNYYLYKLLLEHIITIEFYYITISQILYNLKVISFNSFTLFMYNGNVIEIFCSAVYAINYLASFLMITGLLFSKHH